MVSLGTQSSSNSPLWIWFESEINMSFVLLILNVCSPSHPSSMQQNGLMKEERWPTSLLLRSLHGNHVQHLLYIIRPNFYIHRCMIWGECLLLSEWWSAQIQSKFLLLGKKGRMERGEQVPSNLYHFFICVNFDSHKGIVIIMPLFQRGELGLRNGKKLTQGLKDGNKNSDLKSFFYCTELG